MWVECADLRCEVRREVLDARERLAPAVETRRLQPEERLVLAQVLHERAVTEDIAVMSRHAKHRSACSMGLQRYDRALLLSQLLGRAQIGRASCRERG